MTANRSCRSDVKIILSKHSVLIARMKFSMRAFISGVNGGNFLISMLMDSKTESNLLLKVLSARCILESSDRSPNILTVAPPNNLVLHVPCHPPFVRGWKKHSTLAISNPDGARWAHTISETFLNSFQNLRSIFQNTHNPKENIKLWGIFLENLSICPSSPK